MTNQETKQFVDFNRVVELNEWLRLYGNRIIIDDWQALRLRETGISYILQFHLNSLVACKYVNDDGSPIPNDEQLKYLIKQAYALQ